MFSIPCNVDAKELRASWGRILRWERTSCKAQNTCCSCRRMPRWTSVHRRTPIFFHFFPGGTVSIATKATLKQSGIWPTMEKFFLRHNVLQDRDSDELGGRVNSDSEARCVVPRLALRGGKESDVCLLDLVCCSDDEEEITERVHSVADPTGPWRQKAVDGETWGSPRAASAAERGRTSPRRTRGPRGSSTTTRHTSATRRKRCARCTNGDM